MVNYGNRNFYESTAWQLYIMVSYSIYTILLSASILKIEYRTMKKFKLKEKQNL